MEIEDLMAAAAFAHEHQFKLTLARDGLCVSKEYKVGNQCKRWQNKLSWKELEESRVNVPILLMWAELER